PAGIRGATLFPAGTAGHPGLERTSVTPPACCTGRPRHAFPNGGSAVQKLGKKLSVALAGATAGVLVMTGCSGAGSTGGGGSSGGGGDKKIPVLMVGNPQMVDIQKLTPDNFTKRTGITVKFTILPENELRDKVTQDV